jgi:SAM-dependent methyltransferase
LIAAMLQPENRHPFYTIQTGTAWRRVLESFANWCQPLENWRVLDLGSGPGYLAELLAQKGCRVIACDLDARVFHPRPSLSHVLAADGRALPFPEQLFDMFFVVNVLFLLEDPQPVLFEISRCLRPGGMVGLINPSEFMSLESASVLAVQRNLVGADKDSLLNWAQRAEQGWRWSDTELSILLHRVGLALVRSELRLGPGLAQFSLAQKTDLIG